ncbi:hypothetical protein ALQ08_01780 [Pseudomonas syringae pv. delphinii]|uniref:Uncharacterized protein n=1 Tax=Pseudomonas syringae pv. delphinii TaxID=192088 RepID=A0A0P9U1X0_9PSED|nr:Unknown protein sequence [Pseudomonas syringae pv. delphinii]RMP15863.1 hypothetical protein ALQ28_03265 [Pseudomonas syringae pv. delphinii]RMQ17291.1 hypothetical protein ALQ08_01780 [Pseudomonas syringae pv. delphinii]
MTAVSRAYLFSCVGYSPVYDDFMTFSGTDLAVWPLNLLSFITASEKVPTGSAHRVSGHQLLMEM